ncbi:MAG: hypothetical protein HOP16_12020 [Acidobacteria bacterium]|nr:hypothetical protein [Acidobacteriota bacterium]
MSDKIKQIVQVAELAKALYLLVVEYEEADGGNGVGHLYRTDGLRATVFEHVLSTNDTLRAMWASPSGAVWLASQDGNVWTTAKVRWSKPRNPDLDFLSFDPALKWTVTTLPNLRIEGYPPALGPIWGTDDANVFAASGEHIYHWNGSAWAQEYTAAGTVRAFSGTGPQDVYAVGGESTLLHYDGKAWRRLQNPGDTTGDELFTGACHAADGTVYICSQDGRLLHGSASGLTVLAQNDDIQLRGVALLNDRVLLAAGADGVAELQGSAVNGIRSTFHAFSITPGNKRVFFMNSSSETCYVEYDPSEETAPWWLVTF